MMDASYDFKNSYKKKQWRPPSKKKKRGKNPKPEEHEGMLHIIKLVMVILI
jgi:hypothetical protein